LASIFATLGTVILAIVGLLEKKHCTIWGFLSDSAAIGFYNYRIWIFGIIGGLLIFLSQIPLYRSPKKKELKAILELLQKKQLKHHKNECRFTLFRASRWKAILINFKAVFLKQHKGLRKMYFSQIWDSFRNKRLIIHVRYGEPYEKSLTNFNIPKNDNECTAIVTKVWYTEVSGKVINLPLIKGDSVEKCELQSYAEATNIKNLKFLKSIHSYARHILAIPITNSKAERVMVLVIDSNKDNNPFNEGMTKKLETYSNIVEKII